MYSLLENARGMSLKTKQVEQCLNGTLNLNVDKSIIATELGFDNSYLNNGAVIVEANATTDTLRASLPTDIGANAYYTPAMQTAGGINEMLNNQITNITITHEENSSTYVDQNSGVNARVV